MTAIATGQVQISSSVANQILAPRAGRTQVRLFGLGSLTGNHVLLGTDGTVTKLTGYFEEGSLVLPTDGAVWGISNSGSLTVYFLEVY